MNLSNLQKAGKRERRRLGQGHGSGRGKTAGRGTKGQKARGDIKISFEGGALPLMKRLPFMRGRGHNKSLRQSFAVVSLKTLNTFSPKSVITKEVLVKKGLVSEKEAKRGVKILGNGKLTVSLTVEVPVSRNAASQIEKAGGSVTQK